MASLKKIKKGDKVILHLFTGAYVGTRTVEMADETKIGFTNKDGKKMIFDKATGKQKKPEPRKDQYASFITPYDPKVEAEGIAKKMKKG